MTASLLNWDLLDDPEVIERCRHDLLQNGAMVLKDFATLNGLDRLKSEALEAPFNESENNYTAWQDQGDASYPPSHPRNFKFRASAAFVSRKTMEKSPERLGVSIYNQDKLVEFLSTVAGRKLYRSQDENGSVYSYRIHQSHRPPWHFDESHYTAIIYLQNSEQGGEFELVPWSRPTRSKNDAQGHQVVENVLIKGDTSSVRQLVADPGSLIFFSGARSFHRAAPIGGPTIRVGLVFTFGDSEGFANSDVVKDANDWDPDAEKI